MPPAPTLASNLYRPLRRVPRRALIGPCAGRRREGAEAVGPWASILRYLPVILVRMPPAGRLALLGAAALAVRLLYILVLAPAPVGVGGDAGFYHSAADLIADGRFLYRGIFGHAYVTAEHPPLFPLVLSLVSALGAKTLLAHRLVGCVVGSAAVVLIAVVGRRVARP